ncbi:MAG TPA: prolyl oligopeptidase family serine peptidase, partial [Verrucomicrobiae bacterium]
MKRLTVILAALISLPIHAATLSRQWQVQDDKLMDYFRRETKAISDRCLSDLTTSNAWNERAPQLRAELSEMLGLSPLPPRTDLKATVTKRFEQDTFTVENLHFQSRPGLYVTANLYVPKNLTKPAPTILYVCGHGPVITNGISYGNKFAYHHHGVWFARNGYVCLIIDTLQLGEIQGLHHGTHRENMWWWNSRGYTPAGVECWNGMRALDYLSTRPEVDTNRFGITGRSGGGAYSWFVTAMDDRIKAAAPVAGITDLENHVVDGAVEGHCDCMFFVNTYRWDYPQLAALAAPRPLLLCNSDDDGIFPLDGITRTQAKLAKLYTLLGARDKFGLIITPGPHKDTQELQLPVMRWFNKHLKGEDKPVETAAAKMFSPQQLKVFDTLPGDAVNAKIHETFVEVARAEMPKTKEEWSQQREKWLSNLREKCFPAAMANEPLDEVIGHLENGQYGFRFWPSSPDERPERLALEVMYQWAGGYTPFNEPGVMRAMIVFPHVDTNQLSAPKKLANSPRMEAGEIAALVKKEVQVRRRHMLLGETVDTVRVANIVRAIRVSRASPKYGKLPIRLEASGDLAVNALYASLFAPVDELVLTDLPKSHMNTSVDYLNVLRILDIPQAVAMASERCKVELRG